VLAQAEKYAVIGLQTFRTETIGALVVVGRLVPSFPSLVVLCCSVVGWWWLVFGWLVFGWLVVAWLVGLCVYKIFF
jgi:hypothetical protein